jgi:hypothetical protein
MVAVVLNLRQPGQVRPSLAFNKLRIDWTHPLANQLVSYYFDTGLGFYIDLVTGDTTVTETTRSTGISPYGPGLSSTVTSATAITARNVFPVTTLAAPFSFATGFYQASTGVSLAAIFGIIDASANALWASFDNGGGASYNSDFYNNSGAQFTATPTNGVYYTIVGTASTNPVQLSYLLGTDGTNEVKSSTAPTPNNVPTAKAVFGSYPTVSGQAGAFIFYGGYWSRQLSASEVALLHADPYCFLVPVEGDMPAVVQLIPPSPIFNFDYPLTHTIRASAFDKSVSLNPNIFTNPVPIFDGDQSSSRMRPPYWMQPVPPPLNINIFPPPLVLPLNQYDWSKPFRVPFQPPAPLGNNPNIFTNPYPILNIETRGSWSVWNKPPPPPQPYSNLLYTVTAVNLPFNQYDFSVPRPLRPTPLTPDTLNINLFTNPLVSQFEYKPTSRVPSAPVDLSFSTNFSLLLSTSPQPVFNPDTYQAKFRRPIVNADINYNPNLYFVAPVQSPFNQYDWSKPFMQRPLPNQDQIFNPNIFTNPYPVANQDYFKPVFHRLPLIDLTVPFNPNLFGVVVASPFNQFFYPAAVRIPPPPNRDSTFNPNTQTNPQPFSQFNYPLVSRVPRAPFDLSTSTNPNIFPGAAIPILNINYVPQRKPLPVPLDTSVGSQPFQIPVPPIAGVPSLAFTYDTWVYVAAPIDHSVFRARASTSPSGQGWSGAGFMATYEIDTDIQINGDFINSLTGVYIDPTTINLFVINPNGVTTTYTWPAGTITRVALGHFYQQLTPSVSGVWTYKWQALGAAICTSPDTTFTVKSSLLIPG